MPGGARDPAGGAVRSCHATVGRAGHPTGPTRSLPQDKQLTEVLAGAGNVVTLTIIPTVIYEHMVKR